MSKKAYFADGINTNFDFFKFDKVGDTIEGVLLGSFVVDTPKYAKPTETEKVRSYLILNEKTKKITRIFGRNFEGDVKVIRGLKLIPEGSPIKVSFVEAIPTKSGNDFKKIGVMRMPGDIRTDILNEFKQMIDLSQLATLEEEKNEDPGLPDFD